MTRTRARVKANKSSCWQKDKDKKWLRRTLGAQVHHRAEFFDVLEETSGIGDDGTAVLADVALLAGGVHSAEVAALLQVNTSMALEGRLRIKRRHQAILYKTGWYQLRGGKRLSVPLNPIYSKSKLN
jgi:hypothetical protein